MDELLQKIWHNFPQFEAYRSDLNARFSERIEVRFGNGFGASVVRGRFTYGGPEGLFEMAVLDDAGELHYHNPVADGDVKGWLGTEDVLRLLNEISTFDPEMLSAG